MTRKGKTPGWQRPRFDEEGLEIFVKRSKAGSKAGEQHHTQPLYKSRTKYKGNRKAQGHDLGFDYRRHIWAPFAGGSDSKVSLDVDRFKYRLDRELAIALSLSLRDYKASAAAEDSQELAAPLPLEASHFEGFEVEFEVEFEEEEEEDDASLPEIVSEDEETLVPREEKAAAIGAAGLGGLAPEIDNFCVDLSGAEEVVSEDGDDWSWESLSSGSQDEEGYEFVDRSMVPMIDSAVH